MMTAVLPGGRATSIQRVAENLDLSRHVGEHTAMLADALLEHLLEELAREGVEAERAQDIAMGCVASVMAQCGGDHCYITSLSSAEAEIDKERARKMLRSGFGVRQVVQLTSLSTYQVKRVRDEMDAELTAERERRNAAQGAPTGAKRSGRRAA